MISIIGNHIGARIAANINVNAPTPIDKRTAGSRNASRSINKRSQRSLLINLT
jgi:hypothetical protein